MVIDENKATNISALLVPQATHSANESAITKAQRHLQRIEGLERYLLLVG